MKPQWMVALIGLAALALCACATTRPQELGLAEQAYEQARTSSTASLAPTELYEARKELTAAIEAQRRGDDSTEVKQRAYVALRKVEIARAQARAQLLRAQRANAEKLVAETEAQRQREAQAELDRARAQLNELDAAQKEQSAQLAESQRQQLEQAAALEEERRAREAAEQKAAETMKQLESIAKVREEARGTVITLSGGVLFASGQSALLPSAQERLAQVAEALKGSEAQRFTVEGHTDSAGSESLNEVLSLRRAQVVRDFLVDHGVPAERIDARGYGEARPVADNASPEGRANNRRVEIVAKAATGGAG